MRVNVPVDIQHIERDLPDRLSVIKSVGSPRNFVELFDFIDRTEYSASVHRFDVIDAARYRL
jgi:hypothetical protein